MSPLFIYFLALISHGACSQQDPYLTIRIPRALLKELGHVQEENVKNATEHQGFRKASKQINVSDKRIWKTIEESCSTESESDSPSAFDTRAGPYTTMDSDEPLLSIPTHAPRITGFPPRTNSFMNTTNSRRRSYHQEGPFLPLFIKALNYLDDLASLRDMVRLALRIRPDKIGNKTKFPLYNVLINEGVKYVETGMKDPTNILLLFEHLIKLRMASSLNSRMLLVGVEVSARLEALYVEIIQTTLPSYSLAANSPLKHLFTATKLCNDKDKLRERVRLVLYIMPDNLYSDSKDDRERVINETIKFVEENAASTGSAKINESLLEALSSYSDSLSFETSNRVKALYNELLADMLAQCSRASSITTIPPTAPVISSFRPSIPPPNIIAPKGYDLARNIIGPNNGYQASPSHQQTNKFVPTIGSLINCDDVSPVDANTFAFSFANQIAAPVIPADDQFGSFCPNTNHRPTHTSTSSITSDAKSGSNPQETLKTHKIMLPTDSALLEAYPILNALSELPNIVAVEDQDRKFLEIFKLMPDSLNKIQSIYRNLMELVLEALKDNNANRLISYLEGFVDPKFRVQKKARVVASKFLEELNTLNS